MAQAEIYVLDDKTEVFIENSEGSGVRRASVGEKSQKRHLKEALGILNPTISEIKNALDTETLKPDEVSVEFGVKLSAEVGVIITRASSDMNFKIVAKWKNGT